MVWLKADCDTPTLAAALVKLRSRATDRKAIRSLMFSRGIHEFPSYCHADCSELSKMKTATRLHLAVQAAHEDLGPSMAGWEYRGGRQV
jgi:hypothetical protein